MTWCPDFLDGLDDMSEIVFVVELEVWKKSTDGLTERPVRCGLEVKERDRLESGWMASRHLFAYGNSALDILRR
jgi:hypothetical protein